MSVYFNSNINSPSIPQRREFSGAEKALNDFFIAEGVDDWGDKLIAGRNIFVKLMGNDPPTASSPENVSNLMTFLMAASVLEEKPFRRGVIRLTLTDQQKTQFYNFMNNCENEEGEKLSYNRISSHFHSLSSKKSHLGVDFKKGSLPIRDARTVLFGELQDGCFFKMEERGFNLHLEFRKLNTLKKQIKDIFLHSYNYIKHIAKEAKEEVGSYRETGLDREKIKIRLLIQERKSLEGLMNLSHALYKLHKKIKSINKKVSPAPSFQKGKNSPKITQSRKVSLRERAKTFSQYPKLSIPEACDKVERELNKIKNLEKSQKKTHKSVEVRLTQQLSQIDRKLKAIEETFKDAKKKFGEESSRMGQEIIFDGERLLKSLFSN